MPIRVIVLICRKVYNNFAIDVIVAISTIATIVAIVLTIVLFSWKDTRFFLAQNFTQRTFNNFCPKISTQHSPHFGQQLSQKQKQQQLSVWGETAKSIKLRNYLKTRSKHQTNCGGILLAELFSRDDDDGAGKQELLWLLPVRSALWQHIRFFFMLPLLVLVLLMLLLFAACTPKLIQAAKMARW